MQTLDGSWMQRYCTHLEGRRLSDGVQLARQNGRTPNFELCSLIPRPATGEWVMPLQRLTYRFTTILPVPRARAYRWSTDYGASDLKLAGLRASRKVELLAKDLILLTDSFDADPFNSQRGARTVKRKLVHLYPDRWAWVATHVSGPALHSQFLYKLTPRGPAACMLHFTGSQVEKVARPPTRSSLEHRARELRREDSQLWARFSAAIAKETA
jgi:hypothetical protein